MPINIMRIFVYLLALMTGFSAAQAARAELGTAETPGAALSAAVVSAEFAAGTAQEIAEKSYLTLDGEDLPSARNMAVPERVYAAPLTIITHRGDRTRE